MNNDVFKQLRFKLSFTVASVLTIILSTLIILINIYLKLSNQHSADSFINELVLNDGIRFRYSGNTNDGYSENIINLPDYEVVSKDRHFQKKSAIIQENFLEERSRENLSWNNFFTNFFQKSFENQGIRNYLTALLDNDGVLETIITRFSEPYSDNDVIGLINDVYSLNENNGIYRLFEYKIVRKSSGYLLILLDRSSDINQENKFKIVSIGILFLTIIISFVVAWIIALFVIKPVEKAFIQQKQFIADASHELKTPIAVIGANIDVLSQEVKGNKWVDYIRTENNRMGNLVKDLLYLAKNDAGKDKLEKKKFDLCDVVACSVLPFESVTFEQGKRLVIDIPKEPIMVYADESKIRQVAIIFTDNAIKNSEKGALIRVSVFCEGTKRFIRVYNTGHGVNIEDQKKIFNRFYRADMSRDRVTGGYGLGLSIAQTIANDHGGKVSVRSVAESFAEFDFWIPSGEPNSKHKFFCK